EIREQIALRLRSIPTTDPLGAVEAAFNRADYDRTITEGNTIRNGKLLGALAQEQRGRLYAVLGESKYRQSLDPGRSGAAFALESEALDLLGHSLVIKQQDSVLRIVAQIHNTRAER